MVAGKKTEKKTKHEKTILFRFVGNDLYTNTQSMVYLPACSVKMTKCTETYHTLSVWDKGFLFLQA